MQKKMLLFGLLLLALSTISPSFAHKFINQDISTFHFEGTKQRIETALKNLEKIHLPTSINLEFVLTNSMLDKIPKDSINIVYDDDYWLIERKITAFTLPTITEKKCIFQAAGVSVTEFLIQKKNIWKALKRWKIAGARLKGTLRFRLTSEINFHTIKGNVIWIAISESLKEAERIISLFFDFSFKLPNRTLIARGISVYEYQQARSTIRKLVKRSKEKTYKLPSVFIARRDNFPIMFKKKAFMFPFNLTPRALERAITNKGKPKKIKVYVSSTTESRKVQPKEVAKVANKTTLSNEDLKEQPPVLSDRDSLRLIDQLYHWDDKEKIKALEEIGTYGVQSAAAVPNLLGLINDENQQIRQICIVTLGKIGKPARFAVPGLMLCLDDSASEIRKVAAMSLSFIGSNEALKLLKLNLKYEKEESVKQTYLEAIKRLETSKKEKPL